MPATRQATLFVTATSHLDTQWRWTFRDTIARYLPATCRENFDLFRKFPDYVFSFEGAFRYMLLEEYHPELFAELARWVEAGRWRPAGATLDTGDVNTVSPESLVRQILYGNAYFQEKFGICTRDLLMPDCFGFSWALPTIAAHCGLTTFSTSKLEWGSAVGIPFDVGMWEGPDGSALLALINPGQYSLGFDEDLSESKDWAARAAKTEKACGAAVAFKYFGVGDTGGAPDARSAAALQRSVDGPGPLAVRCVSPDEVYDFLTPKQREKLPRHRGEFLLREHGVGTYTSMASVKFWNRECERLADAAERAAVVADWLGGAPYPHEKLRRAWIRFLANQMHDILPGTCIPEAYPLTWNDQVLSLNEFTEVLKDSVGAVARALETDVEGTPLVVYDPEGTGWKVLEVELGGLDKGAMVAEDPLKRPTPVQDLGNGRFLIAHEGFKAGFAVHALRPARKSDEISLQPISVSEKHLENHFYRAEIDSDGNICSIQAKQTRRELLRSPIRLQLLRTAPEHWPAWTLRYEDVSAKPLEEIGGPATVRVLEEGPLRVALEVTRLVRKSVVVQRWSLTTYGLLECETCVDWRTAGCLLKQVFDFRISGPQARYGIGTGSVERPVNSWQLYEVPALGWAGLFGRKGNACVLAHSRYGWDHPKKSMLRLTLLHSPELTGFTCHLGGANFVEHFAEQAQLDFGRHRFRFAIQEDLDDPEAASRAFLAEPAALLARKHQGFLGREFALHDEQDVPCHLMALKKAEDGNGVVARFGAPNDEFQAPPLKILHGAAAAAAISGTEEGGEELAPEDGAVLPEVPAFGLRTMRLQLNPPPSTLAPPQAWPVEIPFNLDAISLNGNRQDGDLDGDGFSFPGELMPEVLTAEGIPFRLGPTRYKQKNCLVCRGQLIRLPETHINRVYLLACAAEGDVETQLTAGGHRHRVLVPHWRHAIGAWCDRCVNGEYVETIEEMWPGFVRPTPVAFAATHLHSRHANADVPYSYGYLFKLTIKLDGPAPEIHLPDDPRVRLFAITAAFNENDDAVPLSPLFGTPF